MTVAERTRIDIQPLLADEPGRQVAASRQAMLPAALRDAYGSSIEIPLRTDRPTVISNFVSTLDGVVSYNTPEAAGGGEISGFSEPDHFVMGLLRSIADAVLIGAGTLRAAEGEAWSPRFTHEQSADDYSALRRSLGLTDEPTTVVVTASGDVDLAHKGLSDPTVPVLILTTAAGHEQLRAQEPWRDHVEVVSAGTDSVAPQQIVEALRERGMELVLCEGGPLLFGQMLEANLIDELFLTVAPQVAGRSDDRPRLSLVEGVAFSVDQAPWARLVDARRSGSHLFLRYSFGEKSQ
jgi:riboflavin biosynthesis pyrimidine reductase